MTRCNPRHSVEVIIHQLRTMVVSPEIYPGESRDKSLSEDIRPWMNELLLHHSLPTEQANAMLRSIDRMPWNLELSRILQGRESHNYKLGYLAAMILNWRDNGILYPEFLPLAEAIAQKAKELGIEK